MPSKAAVTVALQPDGDAASTAPPKSCPFVLKKVMDIPPPNILDEGDDGKGTYHLKKYIKKSLRKFATSSRYLVSECRTRNAPFLGAARGTGQLLMKKRCRVLS